MIKKIGKSILCSILERQVQRLRAKNDITVIAVGGSVGKTSSKLAIAKVLSAYDKVQFQDGNYNDRLTVPLIFFGEPQPAILNIPSWLGLITRTRRKSRKNYPYKYVVVELGTDGPGQLKDFEYLRPDIYVLTAIAEEHMEYFKTIDAVALEELVPASFSAKTLINIDDVDAKYLPAQYFSYGFSPKAEYRVDSDKGNVTLMLPSQDEMKVTSNLIGKQGAKVSLVSAAVVHLLGLDTNKLTDSLSLLTHVAGRMQQLRGINNSLILDDTYNASPIAVKAALDVLYDIDAPQRIAILGTMNELGDGSAEAHAEVGAYCDPEKLDLVVTIGKQAGEHLAPAAANNKCTVKSFNSPYEAGDFVKEQVKDGALILAKGSQNGVFAEEALKALLADSSESAKLVRQSEYWMGAKEKQFGSSRG